MRGVSQDRSTLVIGRCMMRPTLGKGLKMSNNSLSDYANAMKHRYRVTPGGEFVPGVTTIIGIIDKPAFKWTAAGIAATFIIENGRRKRYLVPKHRAKLASYRGNGSTSVKARELAALGTDNEIFAHLGRGEFDRQWKAKADRGNRVHDVAERWTHGEAVEVAADEVPYVDALEAFHRQYKPVFHLTECVVLHRSLRYGGRFDTIATLYEWKCVVGDGYEGSEWAWIKLGTYLIDYKTGGEYEDSVAMQTIGYMDCELPVYVDGALAGFKELPHLDGARIIYLREDGTFSIKDPFEKIPQDIAREAFRSCLNLFKATKTIASLLGNEEEA